MRRCSGLLRASGDGVGGEVGAGEVGVAGEGGARLAVDEEADLGDAGQIGVQRGADGEHGEGLGFKARGVAGGKGAGEVDDGELGSVAVSFEAVLGADGAESALVAGRRKTWAMEAAPPGTGWAASGAA